MLVRGTLFVRWTIRSIVKIMIEFLKRKKRVKRMANERVNKLTDPDIHLMKLDYYKRLRGALQAISMFVFRMPTTNNMILNFIPHLKRTDRDCGGLPLYTRAYTSAKANKEHALLCVISMVIQVWWDINAGTLSVTEDSIFDELDVFDANLALLEGIAKDGMGAYKLYGKAPVFEILTRQEAIDRDNKIEPDPAEEEEVRKIDAENAKELMNAELGESQEEDSTETDTSDSDPSNSTKSSETEAKNEDTQQEGSSEASSSDQLSVEDADKCCSDCDNCTDRVCELDDQEADDRAERLADGVEEPPAELADLAGAEAKAAHAAGSVNDSEQYPDAEPLEQTIKDHQEKTDAPPMPEEE
jgi:hypothetical protein